ncbi:MAG: hypothetical protein ABI451_02915 [Dokdonella sp.]
MNIFQAAANNAGDVAKRYFPNPNLSWRVLTWLVTVCGLVSFYNYRWNYAIPISLNDSGALLSLLPLIALVGLTTLFIGAISLYVLMLLIMIASIADIHSDDGLRRSFALDGLPGLIPKVFGNLIICYVAAKIGAHSYSLAFEGNLFFIILIWFLAFSSVVFANFGIGYISADRQKKVLTWARRVVGFFMAIFFLGSLPLFIVPVVRWIVKNPQINLFELQPDDSVNWSGMIGVVAGLCAFLYRLLALAGFGRWTVNTYLVFAALVFSICPSSASVVVRQSVRALGAGSYIASLTYDGKEYIDHEILLDIGDRLILRNPCSERDADRLIFKREKIDHIIYAVQPACDIDSIVRERLKIIESCRLLATFENMLGDLNKYEEAAKSENGEVGATTQKKGPIPRWCGQLNPSFQ